MIRLESLSKIYRGKAGPVRALDDVSLEVSAGEFVGVCGPSGCGKSTLLTVIGGLITPTSGQVTIAGDDLTAMRAAERSRFRQSTIGFVFQMFHLLPYLNIVDNVVLAAKSSRRSEARRRATELLNRFGLGGRLAHRPAELSVGERQRVAVARAVLNEPKLLLADEPTGNLDPESADAILGLLADYIEQGGTVLLVTHDERAASRANRIVTLRQGKIEPPVAAVE